MGGFYHVRVFRGRHDGVKSVNDAGISGVVFVRAGKLVLGRCGVESVNIKYNPAQSGTPIVDCLVYAVNKCGVGRGGGADRVNNAALGGVEMVGDSVHAVGGGVPGGKVGGGFLAVAAELRGASFQVLALDVNAII